VLVVLVVSSGGVVVDVLVVVSSGGVLVDVLMLVEMLVVGEVAASTAANASM
jgi:hypothetical protein